MSLDTRAARSQPRAHGGPWLHRGWSLVELLVGLAVGMWLVSMAIAWTLARVRDDARLLADARLTTDLAAALASVAGDLRRAGYWGHAAAGVDPSATAASAVNPYTAIDSAASANAAYSYSRDNVENDALDSNEQFGWRLRGATLELQLGGGGWQAVTDPAALRITRFEVLPSVQAVPLTNLCPTPCPATMLDCPPRVEVRTYTITLQGRSTGDATIERTATTAARVRNDALAGRCAA